MNKRVWTGVVAGALAAMVVLSVALVAYRVGQRHELVTRSGGDGEVVRVVDGHGGGYGPGPGFVLFPLLGIALVILLLRGGRHWNGGWNRPYGPGPDGGGGGGPERAFEEWHRRAHEARDRPEESRAAPRS